MKTKEEKPPSNDFHLTSTEKLKEMLLELERKREDIDFNIRRIENEIFYRKPYNPTKS